MNVFDQGQANRAAQLKGSHVEITTVPSKDGRFQNFQEIKPASGGIPSTPQPLQAVTAPPVPSQGISKDESIARMSAAKTAFEFLGRYAADVSLDDGEKWAFDLAQKIHKFIGGQEPATASEVAQQVNEIMGTEAVKAGPDW